MSAKQPSLFPTPEALLKAIVAAIYGHIDNGADRDELLDAVEGWARGEATSAAFVIDAETDKALVALSAHWSKSVIMHQLARLVVSDPEWQDLSDQDAARSVDQ